MLKNLVKAVTPKPIWNRLRLVKMKRDLNQFEEKIVTHNYGGHDFKIHLRDGLSIGWYDHDWPRQVEVEFLAKHKLKPGAKVFNFGAHQGIVAMMIAREVGPDGRVVAFEANGHNAKAAQDNCALNAVDNLEVLHCAVGETSGVVVFNEGLNGHVDDGKGEWGKVEVQSLSVDDTTDKYGKPDVVLMDIEGFEYCALKGASKTLDMDADWFVEMHGASDISRFGGTVEQVLSHFEKRPFDLYMSQDDKPFVPFDKNHPMVQERFYLVAIRN